MFPYSECSFESAEQAISQGYNTGNIQQSCDVPRYELQRSLPHVAYDSSPEDVGYGTWLIR